MGIATGVWTEDNHGAARFAARAASAVSTRETTSSTEIACMHTLSTHAESRWL